MKKPRKFWKLIKGLISEDDCVDITSYMFKDINTNSGIPKNDVPDFLNEYFVNIARRTCGNFNHDEHDYTELYSGYDCNFDFVPPVAEEMYGYMESMDLNSSSCIPGVNMRICKITLDSVPLKFSHMFATSLFTGHFPSCWTCACVTLLPKTGDRTNPSNWRPISQTNIFAKILEKIVHKQVLAYFIDNKILSERQFGFLPDKSTHEAIFGVVKEMYSTINNNKLMCMTFVDIAKSFNCVDHKVLCKKLRDVAMSNRVVSWFRTYLNRSQIIKYGNDVSTEMMVPIGIAQGTVLGPLMFIFYINDCVNTLEKVRLTLFADDCVLYLRGNNWKDIHEIFQHEFNRFIKWTVKNNLRLNEDKTQVMIVGNKNKLSKLENPKPIMIQDKNIRFVKQYNYLGNVIDSELSLLPMYKYVEKRTVNKVFMLRKLRKYLTYHAALQIYKQTIMPILDYCGILLLACNKSQKYELQVLQNDVLRFCENKRLTDRMSVEKLHKKAKLVSLEQRRCKQVLIMMYKMSKIPMNIVIPARATRLHDKIVFRVDRKVGTKYSNSPYYKGTVIWNSLTKEEQNAETLLQFKTFVNQKYKTYEKDFYV